MSRVTINPNNLKLVTLSGTQQSTLSVANIISLNTITGNNEIALSNVSVGNIINSKLITSSNISTNYMNVSNVAEVDKLIVSGTLTSNASILGTNAYFNNLNMNNGNVTSINNLTSTNANITGSIIGTNMYLNGINFVNGAGTFSSNVTANSSNIGSINSGTINSSNVTISNALNTKNANVSGNLGVKNLFTNGAYFIDSGVVFTANVTMNNANISSSNVSSLFVNNETVYGSLVVTNNTDSTIISNGDLTSKNLSLNGDLTSLNLNIGNTMTVAGAVTMGQLTLTNGDVNLNNGRFNATFGNIGTLTVNNILNVNGINANNANIITSGNLQGGNLNVGNINSTNVRASANIVTTNLTANVVNLGSGNINTTGFVTVTSTVISSSLNTGSGTISTSGNVTAGNVITNKLIVNGDFSTTYTLSSNVANINNANISGNLNAGNINALNMFITSNIAAGNIITGANLTLLGNVVTKGLNLGTSGLTTEGDINAGNVVSTSLYVRNNGSIITTGNINAGSGTINGNLVVGGNLRVNGESRLNGNVSVSGNLTTYEANVNTLNASTISFTDANVNGTLNFNSGRTIITGNSITTGIINAVEMNATTLTASGTMSVGTLNAQNGNITTSGSINGVNGVFTSNVETANLIVTYAIYAPNVVIANGATMNGNIETANLNVSGILTANKIESSNIQDILDLKQSNIGTSALYGNIDTLNYLLSRDAADNLYLGDRVLGNIYIGSPSTTSQKIYIGSTNDTVVIQGAITNVLSTNTQFSDSTLTLNKGGVSVAGSGLLIENNGSTVASMILNNYGKFVFSDVSGRTYDLANIADGNFPQIYATGNIQANNNITTYGNLYVNNAYATNKVTSTNLLVNSNVTTSNLIVSNLVNTSSLTSNEANVSTLTVTSSLSSSNVTVTNNVTTQNMSITNNATISGNVNISNTLSGNVINISNNSNGSNVILSNTLTSNAIDTNSIQLNAGNLNTTGTIIAKDIIIDNGNVSTLDANYVFKVNGYTHFGIDDNYDQNKFGIVTITTDGNSEPSSLAFVRENNYVWQMGYQDNSNDFYIYDGNVGVKLTATNAQSWSSVSDERFKKNIETVDNCLEKIENIRGVYYNYNSDKEGSQRKVGVIAQEVIQSIPEIVDVPENENSPYTVRYQELAPILLNAMKEIIVEINNLKNEISLFV